MPLFKRGDSAFVIMEYRADFIAALQQGLPAVLRYGEFDRVRSFERNLPVEQINADFFAGFRLFGNLFMCEHVDRDG